ncbi:hypothetical protein BGZ51_006050 [Haplosporangium sp. Z 767]|nr:hypothetical protein BGZ50_009474 [Haplosporangium sp. Z 11]KAF9180673.1 hypothetical protein BGZ51_006050 [Haplosporangium sp. Z 767]
MMSCAFGGILAILSKVYGGYAHSIRWIRQGGILEMLKVQNRSGGELPKRVLLALFATTTMNVLIIISVSSARLLAIESVQEGTPFQVAVNTTQFLSQGPVITFDGWSTFALPGSSMEETIIKAINNTRNIPDPIPEARYLPQTFDYVVACDRMEIIVYKGDGATFTIPNNGCAGVVFIPTNMFRGNMTNAILQHKAPGRGKVTIPGKHIGEMDSIYIDGMVTLEILPVVRINYLDEMCMTSTAAVNMAFSHMSGVTSTPKTITTKCLLPSGQAISLSVTSINFSVPNLQDYRNVTYPLLGDQNELVLAMEDSITDGTFASVPADPMDCIEVTEVKATGTDVHALTCQVRRSGLNGTPYLACLYTTISTIIAEPQPMLPAISELRGNRSPPKQPKVCGVLVISHLPKTFKDSLPSFLSSNMLNASSAAAHYFASLGNNFYVDWDDMSLYVVYNVFRLVRGYEIPDWIFGTVIALMVISLPIHVFSEIAFDARYKGSIYRVISEILESRLERKMPSLMRFDHSNNAFENQLLVTPEKPQLTQDNNLYGATSHGSEIPLNTLSRHSSHSRISSISNMSLQQV